MSTLNVSIPRPAFARRTPFLARLALATILAFTGSLVSLHADTGAALVPGSQQTFEGGGLGFSLTGGFNAGTTTDYWAVIPNDGSKVSAVTIDTGGVFANASPAGGSVLAGEDIDAGGTDPVVVTFNSVNISGLTNLSAEVLLAASNPTQGSPTQGFDAGTDLDFLEVQVRYDGGAWLQLAIYQPDTSFNGGTNSYLSLNGSVGNPTAATSIEQGFKNFSYPLNPATTVEIRIRVSSSGTGEYTAIDNFRICGDPAVTNPPVLGNIPGVALMFTEGDGPTAIAPAVTVTDSDSANMTGATVQITGNNNPAEDVLAFTPAGGITTTGYVAATGLLPLSGVATKAQYATALQSVTYNNTNTTNPDTATRTVTLQITDDQSNLSGTATRDVAVINTVQTHSIGYSEHFNDGLGTGDRYAVVGGFLAGADDFFARLPSADAATRFSPAITGVQGAGFFGGEDIDQNMVAGGGAVVLCYNALGYASLSVDVLLAATGTNAFEGTDGLWVEYQFDGGLWKELIAYRPVGGGGALAEDTNADNIGDGTALTAALTNNNLLIPDTGSVLKVRVRALSGTTGEEIAFDTITVNGVLVGNLPVLAGIDPGPLSYTEGDGPVVVSSTATITDANDLNLSGATISISANYVNGEDVLAFTPAGSITGNFVPATGILTLSGSDTLANYETALKSVTYQNTNLVAPNQATRTVTFRVIDADTVSTSNSMDSLVSVLDFVPAQFLPLCESFETSGLGTRYAANTFNLGPDDLFARAGVPHGVLTGANGDGAFAFVGEDTDADGNPVHSLEIAVDSENWTNLALDLKLAAAPGQFETSDFILIERAVNGGPFTRLTSFRGSAINTSLSEDADNNGVGDGAVALGAAFTDHNFALPDALEIRVRVTFSFSATSEEGAVDKIAITGTPPTETVTTLADSGPGSLRDAIANVLSNGFITFAPALDDVTITLTSGQIAISKDLTIDAFSLPNGITLSGNNASRIFNITAGKTVTLRKLSLEDGFTPGNGGAIGNAGDLTIEDCTFRNNAAVNGGALDSTFGTTTTLTRSTFYENAASRGGAIGHAGPLTATNCTFTRNIATNDGGALFNFQTGLDLVHNTITANTAGNGGGISRHDAAGSLTIENSVVAGNTAPTNPEIKGGFVLAGANLTSGDPLLSPLGCYGGCTPTLHPLAGSPVFDAAALTANTPATDQRGLPREVPAMTPDLGAVEGGPVLTVTTVANSGAGSLRQHILDASANPGTRIYFDPAVFPATIATTSQVTINAARNVFIDASGIPSASGAPTGVTVNRGGGASSVLNVADPGTVAAIHGLKFTGGSNTLAGGGVRNTGNAKLTLIASTVTGNTSTADGGGIFNNGAGTRLALFDTTISNNQSGLTGGGIQSNGGARIVIENSTLSGNLAATHGGALNVGGANPTAEITNATLSGNTAGVHGGGIVNNSATALMTLTNATLTANDAGSEGGGLRNIGILELENTLIAGNVSLNTGPDLRHAGGTLTSHGGNFIGDNQGNSFTAGAPNVLNDYVGTHAAPLDPLLGALADNGGPTRTHALRPGSIAIDAAQSVPTLFTDQRGRLRLRDGDKNAVAVIDIGAYETAPLIVVDTALDENDGPAAGAGTSLRDAIAAATDPDGERIVFDPGVFNGQPGDTITLTLGQLLISGKTLEIDGASGGATGVTVSGNSSNRVFQVGDVSDATLRNLTITGGTADNGGGVVITGGANLTTTLRLESCTLTGNHATIGGGAIWNTSQIIHIVNSTISGNTAVDTAGVTNNHIGIGSLVHSTVTGNTATSNCGGVRSFTGSSLLIHNSIIAGNTAPVRPDVQGQLTRAGSNLIGNHTGAELIFPAGTPNANGDYAGSPGTSIIDPMLAALGSYGGPTQTRRPLAGSLALNNAVACPALVDQRGAPRPSGTASDIGAVEAQFTPVVDVLADDGDDPWSGGLSLREAIDFADPIDPVITFHPRLDGARIKLGGTQLFVAKSLAIDASALPRGLTIDADKQSRVFELGDGIDVSMQSLTITGGNAASGDGGGIYDTSEATSLSLTDCTLHGNRANRGGGLFSGTSSDLTITVNTLLRCTISGNHASQNGGGIHNNVGRLYITECTVTNNHAPPATSPTPTSTGGGGVASYGDFSFTETVVKGSIIAGNGAGDVDLVHNNLLNSFTSAGHNLIGTGNGIAAFTATGDTAGVTDPKLSPLACYGGPTPVHHPLAGSPAIDSGDPMTLSSTDQRGFPRVVDDGTVAGTTADRGAVEAGPVLLVSSTADSGAGSLRDQVAAATAPGARLLFDTAGAFSSGGLISLASQVDIAGRTLFVDASNVGGGDVILHGGGANRMIEVAADALAAFQGLRFDGGHTAGSPGDTGGALRNFGVATVVRCNFGSNTSVAQGGAIDNQERLCLVDCLFSSNNASGSITVGLGDGGALFNRNAGSVAEIRGCTFVANTAASDGGAIFNGTANVPPRLEIVNSTFNFNTATAWAGAIYNAGNASAAGAAEIRQSTIVGNDAGSQGGGIRSQGILTLHNTILAQNTAPSGPDLRTDGAAPVFTTLGGNLVGDNSNAAAPFPAGLPNANGDLAGNAAAPLDPLLGPLAFNGGPNLTMRPLLGSPALDAGTGPGCPTTDQRGYPRATGLAPDSGAVELHSLVVNTAVDENDGILTNNVSLRDALAHVAVPPVERITFHPGVFNGEPADVITLNYPTNNELVLSNRDLLIDAYPIAAGVTVSGGNLVRLFRVDTASDIEMAHLTLRDGNALNSTDTDSGAIRIAGASSVALLDCVVDGHLSQFRAGAIYVFAGSTLDATRCAFTNNTSGGNNGGGVLYVDGAGAVATILDSSFTDNTSPTTAGAIHNINGASTFLDGCFFARNTAGGAGAVRNTDTTGTSNPVLVVENCTFADNSSTGEGGAMITTGSSAATAIRHCTMVDNHAGTGGSGPGGGIRKTGTGTLTLENTIVSGNTAPIGPDISGTVTTFAGVNLLGTASGASGLGTLGIDYLLGPALLAPAADYGGETFTMPPLPGSPVIEGAVLLATTPLLDQRGATRPLGPLPDIGAVEAFAFSTLPLVDSDGDFIDDRLEPAYPHLTVGVDDSASDIDSDGSTDAQEIANMTDMLDPASHLRITDLSFAGFSVLGDPLYDITWTSFPGLSYTIQADVGLDFTTAPREVGPIPATDFTTGAQIELDQLNPEDYVRVKRN